MPGSPATTLVTLLSIVTEIAGPVTAKLSLSDLDVSFTALAAMVGALLGAPGTVAGGVYITLVAVVALSVPQPGEHAAPPAVSAQVTPELVESFCTLAFKVRAAVPAAIVVILFVILTE